MKVNSQRTPSKTPRIGRRSPTLKIIDNSPGKVFDIEDLRDLQQKYKVEVLDQIQFHASVLSTKTPQRCLVHNNVYTLYCVNDKKPLCVTCMYQSSSHRKHKVIPLNRANAELEEDIRGFISIVEKKIGLTGKLIEKCNDNYERAEQEFPRMISEITEFYDRLYEVLTKKQNDHINHLNHVRNRVNYEYKAFAAELMKINQFTVQKIKQIAERTNEQYLLYNRNLLCNLAKVDSILKENMCPYHELGYIQDIHNFSDIEVFIRKHLVLTSYMPSKGKGASGRKNTQESKKENSRSPAKKSPQQREREKSRTRESIRARVHTEAAVEELLKVQKMVTPQRKPKPQKSVKFTISDKNLTPKDNESVNDKKIVRSHTKPNGVNISKADKQHIPVSSEKKKENIPK